MHIAGHGVCVPANVDVRAFCNPFVQPLALPPNPVMNVDLLRTVSGEGKINSLQEALRSKLKPFRLVEKVGGEISIPEYEPVLAGVSVLSAVLDECAVRRYACAGTYHDDARVRILGQAEMLVRLYIAQGTRGYLP